MEAVLAVGFIGIFFYLLIYFARHEYVQDGYEEAIGDVEGRLEWARTRTSFPFGMRAQLDVARELLGRAKRLWKKNKWHQAYCVALQSQEAVNKAQCIYSRVIRSPKKAEALEKKVK